MSKYTPGPWSVVHFDVDAGKKIRIDQDNPNGLPDLAHIPCSNGTGKTNLANAHLIVAAPDMYEMLAEIQGHFYKKELNDTLSKRRGILV